MFDMFGPYHLARLNALGEKATLLGLEVFRRSEIYQWKPIAAATTFTRKTLFEDHGLREMRYHVIADRVAAALNDFRPDAVLVPGWASRPAIAMLRSGLPNERSASVTAMTVMSISSLIFVSTRARTGQLWPARRWEESAGFLLG